MIWLRGADSAPLDTDRVNKVFPDSGSFCTSITSDAPSLQIPNPRSFGGAFALFGTV